MDEQTKFAFSSASEIAKQVITLSTGMLAIEITFIKDITPAMSDCDVRILEGTWIMLAFAIMFGVWVLMAITGASSQAQTPSANNIYGNNIKIPASLQLVSFVVSIAMSVIFGIRNV